MLSEKPACGFFYCFIIFSITQIEKFTERKTGTPVFPIAFVQEPKALETSHELSARGLFQTACDSCAGEAQMGKAHLRRHANLRFARISRSRARRRKKNAIRGDSRLRASRRLACRLKRALPAWAYSRWNISYIQTQRYTKSKYILYVRQLVSVEITTPRNSHLEYLGKQLYIFGLYH